MLMGFSKGHGLGANIHAAPGLVPQILSGVIWSIAQVRVALAFRITSS